MVNNLVLPCTRCAECPGNKLPVPGHGPLPCDVLFLGEAPGMNEDVNGIPFVGMTGYELDNTYLRLCGRKRSDVRVSNCVRCRPDNNHKPSPRLLKSCSEANLRAELAACKPRVIVLMGSTACSLDPSIDLQIEHGFPRMASFLGWSGIVVPMYHPASGLHDGKQMTPLLEDFARLKKILDGTYTPPRNPYPQVDYYFCRTANQFHGYMAVFGNALGLTSIDTEGHGRRKFSIQICREPGTGIMIMADNKPVVDAMVEWFNNDPGELLMQFAEHDLDFLQELGCNTRRPDLVVWDTMRDAYNIASLPQGLKQMTFRTQLVRMRTWEDVVLPHSKAALQKWLPMAIASAASRFSINEEIVTYNKSKIELALNRINKMRDYDKMRKALHKLYEVDGYHQVLSNCWKPPDPAHPRFNRWMLGAIRYASEHLKIKKVKMNVKKGELQRGLERIHLHTTKATYKSWDKLRELQASLEEPVQMVYVEKDAGEMPLLGIGNVPLQEALMYAVGDADFTLRNALWMARRRKELEREWAIAPGDEDK